MLKLNLRVEKYCFPLIDSLKEFTLQEQREFQPFRVPSEVF
jgi:hypothetical protein